MNVMCKNCYQQTQTHNAVGALYKCGMNEKPAGLLLLWLDSD